MADVRFAPIADILYSVILPSNFQVVHRAHMLAFDGRGNIVADALLDLSNQFIAIGDMEKNFQVSYGWG